MSLIIRKAVAEDAMDMANILMRSWEVAYAGIIPDEAIRERNAGRLAMWQRTLSGEHHGYIVLADDTPVGLMTIHPCFDDDLPDAGEVGAIYLHPDHWDKGYGREMMNFALDTLKKQGFSVITLWVLEDNVRARRFYEKCGFASDGTQKMITIGNLLNEVRYRIDIVAGRAVDIRTCSDQAATLIRRSFATVAEEFHLTPENCPSNPAFTTAEALVHRLDRENCYSFAMYVGDEMVGFVALMPSGGGACEITRLAVAPEKRHNGYGRLLIDAAIAKAKVLHAKSVAIGIIDANTVLKTWYSSNGFVETGTKEYPFLPFTVCEMEMDLS